MTKLLPLAPTGSFLSSLSFADLQRLRAHVRKVHMPGWPRNAQTDRECDRIIETYGPAAAEAAKKKAIEAKLS